MKRLPALVCQLDAALAALTVPGCFTGPINHKPDKPILSLASFYHGQPASVSISATDADGDTLSVYWGTKPGECVTDMISGNDMSWTLQIASSGQTVTVPEAVTGNDFCLCALVSDDHGASNSSCTTARPMDRPPVPTIVVKAPQGGGSDYPLYSSFQLSVSATDPDMDQVDFASWAFTDDHPAASVAVLMPCAAPDTDDRCFTADQPGSYTVGVWADDKHGGTAMATKTVSVAQDRLPCIGMTEPALSTQADTREAKLFQVDSVDDDGPNRMIHFTWYEGPETGPLLLLGDDFFQLMVAPDPTLVGQTRRVRVEISDVNKDKITGILNQCGDADTCYADQHAGCALRVTWKVSYVL